MSTSTDPTAAELPEILARGPWELEQIKAHWREEEFEPSPQHTEAADAAITALRERGSPSHDGVAARLVDFRVDADGIAIELQPLRWALRLVAGDASHSVAALCVTRSADGRWLAGRRAPWVASWAGRWALGAGGAVDLGESPAETLVRELEEEWSVAPERVRGEALICLPQKMVMFVGQAWIADGRRGRGATRRRARRVRLVAARDRRVAGRGWRGAAADGSLAVAVSSVVREPRRRSPVAGARRLRRAGAGPLTFTRLKWVSLTHSCVYTALLVCAFAAGSPQPLTFVLGLTHGLLWIFMSLACLAAARLRIVSLRLAVAVAVLGGIGPFFGSYEFIREQRQRDARSGVRNAGASR